MELLSVKKGEREPVLMKVSDLANYFRFDIFVKGNDGRYFYSFHRHLPIIKELMEKGLSVSIPESRSFMFTELIQSEDIVSGDVLDYVAKETEESGYDIDYTGKMSLVENPYIFEWFLKRGIKCTHVSGYGTSTMEFFVSRYEMNLPGSAECLSLLKKYDAIDYDYIEKGNINGKIKEMLFKKEKTKW